MIFDPSEEQEAFRESVSRFFDRGLPPTRLRELFDSGAGHDADLWRGLTDLGLLGMLVSEANGGSGLSFLDAMLIADVCGYHALPLPLTWHLLILIAVERGGDAAQIGALLPQLVEGSIVGTIALDALADGQPPTGGTGTRTAHLVPSADAAGLVLVSDEADGLALLPTDKVTATRAAPVADRTRPLFEIDYRPDDILPLSGGGALRALVRNAARLLISADALGGARRCLDLSIAHAKMREQYGAPIGSFQAVKHQIVDMAAAIEPCHGLCWYAAQTAFGTDAEAGRIAALTKAQLTETFRTVSRAAVEVHGGIGYTWEHELQVWFKRAMFDFAVLGTPQRCFALAAPQPRRKAA